jgi:hypothetical protein
MALTNRRPEPGNQLLGWHGELAHRFFQNPAGEPTPSRMRRANRRAIAGRKQHRHAVGDLDDAHTTGLSRDRSVRARRLRRPGRARLPQRAQFRHFNPMHLLQPNRLIWQPQPIPHPTPILRNRITGITNMRTQVE